VFTRKLVEYVQCYCGIFVCVMTAGWQVITSDELNPI